MNVSLYSYAVDEIKLYAYIRHVICTSYGQRHRALISCNVYSNDSHLASLSECALNEVASWPMISLCFPSTAHYCEVQVLVSRDLKNTHALTWNYKQSWIQILYATQ